MVNKINSVLKEVLGKVDATEDLKENNQFLKEFLKKLHSSLKNKKIKAEVFLGGSFAKGTVVKKDKYDADIFLRFDKKYEEKEISDLTEKILKSFSKNVKKIHGSRDYFQIKSNSNFYFEIIPVKKVGKPEEANNITDLSYSHVKYINKKIKNAKLKDEIKLAKAFCYAKKCYGAESYIHGFSGYGIELLVYHFGSFQKFLKEISKIKDKKIIDIEKQYKNKNSILIDLNQSKLNSPIILIDPTYKQRNALAALSNETFSKFQKECSKFLKTPSVKAFEIEKTDLTKIQEQAKKNKNQFVLLEAKTKKQDGDIAGSKLLKFYNHLTEEITKYFDVKQKGFNYNQKKSARYFFVVKSKKEIILNGPNAKDVKNVAKFKKKHKKTFIKKNKIYSKEKIVFTIKEFMNSWKASNKVKVVEMSILDLRVV